MAITAITHSITQVTPTRLVLGGKVEYPGGQTIVVQIKVNGIVAPGDQASGWNSYRPVNSTVPHGHEIDFPGTVGTHTIEWHYVQLGIAELFVTQTLDVSEFILGTHTAVELDATHLTLTGNAQFSGTGVATVRMFINDVIVPGDAASGFNSARTISSGQDHSFAVAYPGTPGDYTIEWKYHQSGMVDKTETATHTVADTVTPPVDPPVDPPVTTPEGVLYQEVITEISKVPCLKWTLNRGEMAIVPAMMARYADSNPFAFWINDKKCLMGPVYTREYLGKPASGFCIKKLYLKMGFENARGAFNFPDLNGLYGIGMANKTDLTNSTYYDKTNEQLLTELEAHISSAPQSTGDTPLSDVPHPIYCVVDNLRLYVVIQEFPLSYSTSFIETSSNQRYIGYMAGEAGLELHIPLSYITASTITVDIPPEYENTNIVAPTVVEAAPPKYHNSSANKITYNYEVTA